MSISFDGFVGPSYQYESKWAAIEKTSNFYLVVNESQEEKKFVYAFAPSPANAAFCQLPVPAPFNQPTRGLLEYRGVVYGVNGTIVFSIDKLGAFVNIGTVYSDGNPCSMVGNGTGQVFIASGGQGYVIPAGGGANSLIPITTDQFLGAKYATMQDDYVIVASTTPAVGTASTTVNQFQVSGDDNVPVGDATLWNAANFSIQTGQADQLRAVISRRSYLRLLGSRRTQVFSNSGNIGQPFQSYTDTFIEIGCGAPFSLCDLGDSLIWIGEDERGMCACWRDFAFQPQRVSNFAIEQLWQSYPRLDDAVAFTYIWKGHLFYQITFPSAIDQSGSPCPKTWVFDATVSQLIGRSSWHERQYLNATNELVGRPEYFHCYAYGKHLVASGGADGNPGAIYQYSDSVFADCGTDNLGNQTQQAIVRDRICPHLWNQNVRIFYNRIQFELARGVGLDGWGLGTDPVISLRWSNDGGNTWTSWYDMSVGMRGHYGIRVLLNRLGYGRDRVYHLRCSDPVYFSIIGAELDLMAGTS